MIDGVIRRILKDVDPHRIGELRSLAYHRAVSRMLDENPALLETARSRVAEWITEDRSCTYARNWAAVLAGPLSDVQAVLVEESERCSTLRSCTPFAGALSPRERWKIWREVHT